jgi:hypothetical protein
MKNESEIYHLMIIDLRAIEDDLVANGSPIEAVRGIQEVIRICEEDFIRRFGT